MKTKKNYKSLPKLTRPQVKGVLKRERLFEKFGGGCDVPLTWVAGPPGSGKTTLVGSYIEHGRLSSLWYRLDVHDTDLSTFFHYLGIAGKKAAPRRKPLPHLTPEYVMGITIFARNFFEDLYARIKPPFIVIFDNYQDAAVNPVFHELMNIAISVLPAGGMVILISREEPSQEFARLLANRKMNYIGWDDLRLTPEETHKIISIDREDGISMKTALQYHKSSGGWAAGVVLMLEKARYDRVEFPVLQDRSSRMIFDYFAGEIFDKAPAGLRDFLMKTAYLPFMSISAAGELTGNENAGKIFSDLYRKHYFIEKRPGSEKNYQFHPLFREFLLARADEAFRSDEIGEIEANAAVILEESGDIEYAAELYERAQNWDRLSLLILTHAQTLISQGRNMTLQKWLNALPESNLRKNPYHLFWMGVCLTYFQQDKALEYFSNAYRAFKSGKDGYGLLLAWSGAVQTFMYGWNKFYDLDFWIKEFEDNNDLFQKSPSPDMESRIVASMLAALILRSPNHPDISQWVKKAENTFFSTSDIELKMTLANYLMLYYLWKGDIHKAGVLHNSLADRDMKRQVNPLSRQFIFLGESMFKWLSGSPDESIKVVEAGLQASRESGIHVFDGALMGQGCYAAFTSGDIDTGKEYLEKMKPLVRQDYLGEYSHYLYLKGWDFLCSGDMEQAYEYLMISCRLAVDAGFVFPQSQSLVALAAVHVEKGDYGKADESISRAGSVIKDMDSALIEYACLSIKAYSFIKTGQEQKALLSIKKMMKLGAKSGMVNIPWWRPQIMKLLCTVALENETEVEYVRELIRRRNLLPDPTSICSESWPWNIKIYTLGKFGIVIDGRPVKFSGKIQKMPLTMLKAIIALGGRNVGIERLSDALWPDADGDSAALSFKTTLHRLRKILGGEQYLTVQGGRASLDNRYCWIDIWELQRKMGEFLEQSEKEHPGAESGPIIKTGEKAIGMYKGVFLPEDSSYPWSMSTREHLRRRFLECIERLGEYYVQRNKWEKAVNCYRRGLEIDDLVEEFYHDLMICLKNMDRRAEAIQVYERCRDMLSASFGIEPNPKIQRVYRELKS